MSRITWVLRSILVSSGREASALNTWVISPAHLCMCTCMHMFMYIVHMCVCVCRFTCAVVRVSVYAHSKGMLGRGACVPQCSWEGQRAPSDAHFPPCLNQGLFAVYFSKLPDPQVSEESPVSTPPHLTIGDLKLQAHPTVSRFTRVWEIWTQVLQLLARQLLYLKSYLPVWKRLYLP